MTRVNLIFLQQWEWAVSCSSCGWSIEPNFCTDITQGKFSASTALLIPLLVDVRQSIVVVVGYFRGFWSLFNGAWCLPKCASVSTAKVSWNRSKTPDYTGGSSWTMGSRLCWSATQLRIKRPPRWTWTLVRCCFFFVANMDEECMLCDQLALSLDTFLQRSVGVSFFAWDLGSCHDQTIFLGSRLKV